MSITRPVPAAVPPGPLPPGVTLIGPVAPGWEQILRPEALAFVAALTRESRSERRRLLLARQEAQERFDAGEDPGFLPETAAIRVRPWRIEPLPPALRDRQVEITGPVTRKMVINGLNSGANVFMADLEDASTPTWEQMVQGQVNLSDAVRRTIEYVDPKSSKKYRLKDRTATLMVRPRGLHLSEKHLLVDGEPVPASLFDLGLFLFHNGSALNARDAGPYLYLPKLEHYQEAVWYRKLLYSAERRLGLPLGSVRVTALIETLPAAFQMDEILYGLGPYAAGLNCGRWDYIFSYVKVFRAQPDRVLPDRDQVGMNQPFLRSLNRRLIEVCHRRGALAIGGMAAEIPDRTRPEANAAALAAVRADKEREARDGHDGTWVAHPGLVAVAREAFERLGRGQVQNQAQMGSRAREEALLEHPSGRQTLEGLRRNVRVGVLYLEAWLRGVGCVPLFGRMEDAATAEICRAQAWQWARHQARLEDGTVVDGALVQLLVEEAFGERREEGRMDDAMRLFVDLTIEDELEPFFTLSAYERLD